MWLGGAVAVGWGCGDDATTPADAGTVTDATTPDGGGLTEPTAPSVPALPDMPCPEGWRTVAPRSEGGPSTCDPFPESGPQACGEHEAPFLGGSGCIAVGGPCPAGDFADDLPSDATVYYVLAGAASGGDGSRATPFDTIAEATAVAADGDVIAVGKGAYDEAIDLPRGVSLWGACPAETTLGSPAITGAAALVSGTVRARGGDSRILRLSIGGSAIGVVASGAGVVAHVEDVVIAAAWVAGIRASAGARIVGRNVVVRDLVATALDTGSGLVAIGGATIELSGGWLERTRTAGVLADGTGSRIVLGDVAVVDTQSTSDGQAGYGLHVANGAAVEATRCAIVGTQTVAVAIRPDDASATLSDCLIRDAAVRPDGRFGRAIATERTATVSVTRTTIEGSAEASIAPIGTGTRVELADVVLRDNTGQVSGAFGEGVFAQDGAELVANRIFIENVRYAGIVLHSGASATLADLTIRDVASQASDLMLGRGIAVLAGSHLVGDRVAIERVREIAVFAEGLGTDATLRDLRIADVDVTEGLGIFGAGLRAQHGASVDIERALFERTRSAAMSAGEPGTSITLTDVVLRETEADAAGQFGRGIDVGFGASVQGERIVVSNNRDWSVIAFGEGSSIRLVDAVVEGTRARACVPECDPAGTGVGAYSGANVSLERFDLANHALCGAQLSTGGTVDLRAGVVRGNLCGVNVQTVGFDLTRLMDGVRYVDNEVNLDARELPVPDPAVPMGGI